MPWSVLWNEFDFTSFCCSDTARRSAHSVVVLITRLSRRIHKVSRSHKGITDYTRNSETCRHLLVSAECCEALCSLVSCQDHHVRCNRLFLGQSVTCGDFVCLGLPPKILAQPSWFPCWLRSWTYCGCTGVPNPNNCDFASSDWRMPLSLTREVSHTSQFETTCRFHQESWCMRLKCNAAVVVRQNTDTDCFCHFGASATLVGMRFGNSKCKCVIVRVCICAFAWVEEDRFQISFGSIEPKHDLLTDTMNIVHNSVSYTCII
jgi:hypothetical protein